VGVEASGLASFALVETEGGLQNLVGEAEHPLTQRQESLLEAEVGEVGMLLELRLEYQVVEVEAEKHHQQGNQAVGAEVEARYP
jgi:hypothetical protein